MHVRFPGFLPLLIAQTLVGFMYQARSAISAEMINAVAQLPCVKEVQFDSRNVQDLGTPKIMVLATIATLKTVAAYGQSAERTIRERLENQCSAPAEFLNKLVFIRAPHDDRR